MHHLVNKLWLWTQHPKSNASLRLSLSRSLNHSNDQYRCIIQTKFILNRFPRSQRQPLLRVSSSFLKEWQRQTWRTQITKTTLHAYLISRNEYRSSSRRLKLHRKLESVMRWKFGRQNGWLLVRERIRLKLRVRVSSYPNKSMWKFKSDSWSRIKHCLATFKLQVTPQKQPLSLSESASLKENC